MSYFNESQDNNIYPEFVPMNNTNYNQFLPNNQSTNTGIPYNNNYRNFNERNQNYLTNNSYSGNNRRYRNNGRNNYRNIPTNQFQTTNRSTNNFQRNNPRNNYNSYGNNNNGNGYKNYRNYLPSTKVVEERREEATNNENPNNNRNIPSLTDDQLSTKLEDNCAITDLGSNIDFRNLPSTSQSVDSNLEDKFEENPMKEAPKNGTIKKKFHNNNNRQWQNGNNRRYYNQHSNNDRKYYNKPGNNRKFNNREDYNFQSEEIEETPTRNEFTTNNQDRNNLRYQNNSKYPNYRNGRNNNNDRNYYNNRREQRYKKYENNTINDKEINLERSIEENIRATSMLQPTPSPTPPSISPEPILAITRREELEKYLLQDILECFICYDTIKSTEKIWSCKQCYTILHFKCIKAWIRSSIIDNKWNCPACIYAYDTVPITDQCYCGKQTGPKFLPGVLPHACGDLCERKGLNCEHKCLLLCHPGPCPECQVNVEKFCGCGKMKKLLNCQEEFQDGCGSICLKYFDCGLHQCEEKCHLGTCGKCIFYLEQICYCGREKRTVNCTIVNKNIKYFNCDGICLKKLDCQNHECMERCHDGPCNQCKTNVNIKKCPCGQTDLIEERVSCLDTIPTCNKICNKILHCGPLSEPHRCLNKCHSGGCPPCLLTTMVKCRCGYMYKELPCEELNREANQIDELIDNVRCTKKCTKKRLCGKHRCNQPCCIEIEHICPLPCNHLLACGKHRCERTCHSGHCPPCTETSFEELYCECGKEVIYPPIPCGTKPPECNNPCPRERECGHDVNHKCHTGPCPPCTILCKRWCFGKHEQRSAIPCHQNDFSCGLPCGKDMPCGKHKCNKLCHSDECPNECKQPCNIKRSLCGHACNAPCHQQTPCPNISCKAIVQVTCECGVQKGTRKCIEVNDEFKRIEMANLKDEMSNLTTDNTVDVRGVINKNKIKPTILKVLECNEECRVFERNRRLAIGLQIKNPDLSQKLTPQYSDFMRQWAKKDSNFCQRVHDKLTDLVKLAKDSKQKSRSYSFESMNHDKRRFIHEYCEHFGCDSAAYDKEPNRNVVATAIKDKSWLPSMSLLQVIQRENGQRKVPGPVINKNKSSNTSKLESVSLKLPTGRLLQRFPNS